VVGPHAPGDPLRHHHHIDRSTFGDDPFGRAAERFARFFGTSKFLGGQSILIIAWIAFNVIGLVSHWDPYPFILLNLVFSTQAAYAAPLILLAQNRQADRDKHDSAADAAHREELAATTQALLHGMSELLAVNTGLTQVVHDSMIEMRQLLIEVHGQVAP
jgi:uncharacterized membrane protein